MAAKGVAALSSLALALAFLALSAAPAAAAGPGDWPMYGGSAAHGFSNTAAPPAGLGLVWSLAGNATLGSAVEADGFTYVGDVDRTAGPHLVVHKLMESDGDEDPAMGGWTARAPIVGAAALAPPRSLAVDGGRVFALVTADLTGSAEYREVLVALDAATGARLWTFNGTEAWTASPPNATRSAPAVSGGVVVFGAQDGNGTVYAVNAATGTLAWWFPTGSPVRTVPAIAGDLVYVTSGTTLFYLDAQGLADGDSGPVESGGWTGDLLLAVATGASAPIEASPMIAGPALVLDVAGATLAFDRNLGSVPVWGFATAAGSAGTPAALGASLFVRRSDGRVIALNAATGELLWIRASLTAPVGGEDMAAADGRLFLSARNGTTHDFLALDAADGAILWRNTSALRARVGAPVVAGTKVLVADGPTLLAFRGQPDLAVVPADVTMGTAVVANGVAHANVTVTVRNEGDEPASNVRVRVYDGAVAPENLVGDLLLATARPISPGGRASGTTPDRDWTVGRHVLTIVVDRATTETEVADNEATVLVYVQAGPSPPPNVVGEGPYVFALLAGILVGVVVLIVPLRRLRALRRKEEPKPPVA